MATSASDLTLYRYKCTNKGYIEKLGDSVVLRLMLIPSGEFMMGAPEEEPGSREYERPQRLVKVAKFLMGCYPITQAQWRIVANYSAVNIDLDPDPSRSKGNELPVERVAWEDAVEFCNRLSTRTRKNYHLPSEAQWEYACRAETTTAYHFGEQITAKLANHAREIGATSPVSSYPPNRWGLYDMHGNVDEWCQDIWHPDYKGAPIDGTAWINGGNAAFRIARGGSWNPMPKECRAAFRYPADADDHVRPYGFRVVCSAPTM